MIGHKDIANIVSNLLGVELPMNREAVKLSNDDVLIVAQYVGSRLPEGATTLPDMAKIDFYMVSIR